MTNQINDTPNVKVCSQWNIISFFCLQQNNQLIISLRHPFKLSLGTTPKTSIIFFSVHIPSFSSFFSFSVYMATCQILEKISSKENIFWSHSLKKKINPYYMLLTVLSPGNIGVQLPPKIMECFLYLGLSQHYLCLGYDRRTPKTG